MPNRDGGTNNLRATVIDRVNLCAKERRRSTQKVALLEYLQKITTVTLYLEENDPWRLDEVTRRTVGKTDQQETDRLALMQEQLEKMMEQLQELKDMQS
jgi:hypothetical protein